MNPILILALFAKTQPEQVLHAQDILHVHGEHGSNPREAVGHGRGKCSIRVASDSVCPDRTLETPDSAVESTGVSQRRTLCFGPPIVAGGLSRNSGSANDVHRCCLLLLLWFGSCTNGTANGSRVEAKGGTKSDGIERATRTCKATHAVMPVNQKHPIHLSRHGSLIGTIATLQLAGMVRETWKRQ